MSSIQRKSHLKVARKSAAQEAMMSTLQQERLTTEAVSEETFDVFGVLFQFLVTPQQTNEQART